jgi:hypothetical protein
MFVSRTVYSIAREHRVRRAFARHLELSLLYMVQSEYVHIPFRREHHDGTCRDISPHLKMTLHKPCRCVVLAYVQTHNSVSPTKPTPIHSPTRAFIIANVKICT